MSPKKRRRTHRRSQNSRKLAFRRFTTETLEDRRLLASVTVSNTLDVVNGDTSTIAALTAVGGDGGDGISLREAVAATNNDAGADIITFDASLSGQTIALAGSELLVTDTLVMDASALASSVTIDAQHQSRPLRFTGSGDLGLNKLTIQNGQTPDGGGGVWFDSPGTLHLTDTIVSGNTTTGIFAEGGGVYATNGNVQLDNSHVTDNITSGSYRGRGGGIYTVSGNVSLDSSTVSGNRTSGTLSPGGGVFSQYGNVMLDASRVFGNRTTGVGSNGGGVGTFVGNITLNDSQVYDNRAEGGSSDGGGLSTSSGSISVTNSAVRDNFSGRDGGGIYSWFGYGTLTATGSTISGNQATFDGGGIHWLAGTLDIDNSTISGNSALGAGSKGGGIYLEEGELTMRSSTVTNNTADSGGGLYFNNANYYGPLQTITIANTIIAANTGTTAANDLFWNPDPEVTLHVDHSLIGDADGSTITVATGVGNLLGSSTGSGAIDPMLGVLADNGGTTQTHALLAGSPAIDVGDPAIINGFDQRGTPFLRVANAGVDMGAFESISVVVNSTADSDDGDIYNGLTTLREFINQANRIKGADLIAFDTLFDSVQTIQLLASLPVVTDDLALVGPGAELLTIDAGNGNDNVFGNGDGFRVLSIDDGNTSQQIDVQLSGLTLSGGDSNAAGGAIANFGEQLQLTQVNVSANAGTDGGGIYSDGGTLTIIDSAVANNSASLNGGGVFATGSLTMANSTLSSNTAVSFGGGLEASGAADVRTSTIMNNSASQGGGIHLSNGTINLRGSIVAGSGLASDVLAEAGTTVTGSFNLVQDGSDGLADTIADNPLLLPLADNGGPTPTHAVLGGSPVINASDPALASLFDQRGVGFPRSQFQGIDIGAVEFDDMAVPANGLVVDTILDVFNGVYTVGDLSLREAVGLANGNGGADTITFDASLSGQTIALAGSELLITDTLAMDASALASSVTIDAQHQSRPLRFTGSGDLSLNKLTIQNGQTPDGGGGVWFDSPGTLQLTDTIVSGNTTTGIFAEGGGVYATNGDVQLDNSHVTDNITSGSYRGRGGGIYTVSGNVSLDSSTVSGNRTSGTLSPGGGVFSQYGNVMLDASRVFGNRTTGAGSNGGGVGTFVGNITLNDSQVYDNRAEGGSSDGGGLSTSSGSISVTNSTVRDNFSGRDGGGIYSWFGYGTLTATGSTISGNQATFDGGGIHWLAGTLDIDNSTISGNRALGVGSKGGGIYLEEGELTMRSSTVTNNTADSGGGLYFNNANYYGPLQTITVANTIIAANTGTTAANDLFWNPDPEVTLNVDHSLIGDADGSTITVSTGVGNLLGSSTGSGVIDPMLGVLANNGGTTQTHALLAGSPAIDVGNSALTSDQRGFSRPFDVPNVANASGGNSADMGAVEFQFPIFTSPDAVDVPENSTAVVTLMAIDDNPEESTEFRLLGQAPVGDLGPGASLEIDQTISSPDGTATLIMQADGNLVVYDSGVPVWSAGTDGSAAVRATIQEDGNLQLIDNLGGVVFQTNSSSALGSLARLHVTDDGLLQILRVDNAKLWEGTPLPVVGTGTTFNPDPLAIEFTKAVDTDAFTIATNDNLQFHVAPDFEVPSDADGNNIYEVSVLADDGAGGVTPQTVMVTVIDLAEPQTYVVDIALDENDGNFSVGDLSLREAIALSNANLGADTIEFDAALAGQVVAVNPALGGLVISDDVSISGDIGNDGTPDITVSGGGDYATQSYSYQSVVTIDDGDNGSERQVLIDGLVIRDGVYNAFSGAGGGIFNRENLTLTNSVVTGNQAFRGGGLYNLGTAHVADSQISYNYALSGLGGGLFNDGQLTIERSTISGSSYANWGGGIYNDTQGMATISSSTVHGNDAYEDGGIRNNGTLTMTNSTVSDNFGDVGGILNRGTAFIRHSTIVNNRGTDESGGIDNVGALTISNSLVAGNLNTNGIDEIRNTGTITADYSLFGHSSLTTSEAIAGFVPDATNVTATSDGTQPTALASIIDVALNDNGGPTLTHAIPVDSPAINAGDPAAMGGMGGTPPVDQRGMGFARVNRGRLDIGAYETAALDGDFDNDGDLDDADIDALIANIAVGPADPATFDLTNDGFVNLADRDHWLALAGSLNLPSGNAYLLGDANLDGFVDGQDFIVWNDNKFTATPAWTSGDFTADGIVDGQDFIRWNDNKFQSADTNLIHRPAPAGKLYDDALASLFDDDEEQWTIPHNHVSGFKVANRQLQDSSYGS